MAEHQTPLRSDAFIVVVGCGRLGAHVASRLSAAGCGVVVVDSREEAFAGLSAEFSGFRVEGDATEMALLRKAKVEEADVVIAATREDNVNLMVAQVALNVLGTRRVVARVTDPQREAVFRELGIETICPTTLGADLLVRSLSRPAPSAGSTVRAANGGRP